MSTSTIKSSDRGFMYHGQFREIDESATLAAMRVRHPGLFYNRDGSAKRLARGEEYYAYRGFVIITGTVQFTGQPPEHKVVCYAVYRSCRGWDDVCIMCRPEPKSLEDACKFIDKLLDEVREYKYGVDLS